MSQTTRKARQAPPLWQPIAAVYALSVFAIAAGLRIGALVFGWTFGEGC